MQEKKPTGQEHQNLVLIMLGKVWKDTIALRNNNFFYKFSISELVDKNKIAGRSRSEEQE